MELIDPLKGAATPTRTQAAGLVDPLASAKTQAGGAAVVARVGTAVAGYELGNLDVCPDCGETMEQMIANDVLCNVCIKHRVCLPVKDKVTE